MNKKQIIEHLNRFPDDTNFIMDLWTEEDILLKANEMDIELTPEQLELVMWRLQKIADQAIGLDWDVVEFWIDDIVKAFSGDERTLTAYSKG